MILLRDGQNGSVRYVAMQDSSLVYEGPRALVNEQQFLEQLDRLQKCLTDSETRPSESDLKKFGQDLADALFPGEIRQLMRNSGPDGVKLGICCDDNSLKRIPWEYIVCPGDRSAPVSNKSVARIVPISSGSGSGPTMLKKRKLRVALVVADPSDMNALPWEQLERTLRDMFKSYLDQKNATDLIDLQTFGGVTRNDLRQKLSKTPFDIIHFIGHGDSDGLYMLNKLNGQAQLVPTQSVINIFAFPSVQLVILSACSTAEVRKATTIGPLAEELVSQQVPAVVGSQLPIPDSTSADFCTSLYSKLLENGDIDDAVTEGRIALQTNLRSTGDSAAIEWGIPVLYRRPGRSKLFERPQ